MKNTYPSNLAHLNRLIMRISKMVNFFDFDPEMGELWAKMSETYPINKNFGKLQKSENFFFQNLGYDMAHNIPKGQVDTSNTARARAIFQKNYRYPWKPQKSGFLAKLAPNQPLRAPGAKTPQGSWPMGPTYLMGRVTKKSVKTPGSAILPVPEI